jgi:hypothetical protein
MLYPAELQARNGYAHPTIEPLAFEFVLRESLIRTPSWRLVSHRVDDVIDSDAHAEVGEFERIIGRV